MTDFFTLCFSNQVCFTKLVLHCQSDAFQIIMHGGSKCDGNLLHISISFEKTQHHWLKNILKELPVCCTDGCRHSLMYLFPDHLCMY